MLSLVFLLLGCFPLLGLYLNHRDGQYSSGPVFGVFIFWSIAAWLHFGPILSDRWITSSTAPHAPSGTCSCVCPVDCQQGQPEGQKR